MPLNTDPVTVRSRLHDFDSMLTDEQLDAAVVVATNRHALLVGPAGTGKSRVLAALANLYSPGEVMVGATTSAAAANIQDHLDPRIKVGTLHSLLRLRPGAEWPPDSVDVPGLKACKLFVVEEASMADTELVAGVLARLPVDCQVVLTGDDHQLPAVGAGDVLRDLTNSGVVPVARLTTQHRTTAVRLSRCLSWVRSGAPGKPTFPTLQDYEGGISFVETSSSEMTRDEAVSLATVKLPNMLGVPPESILVLTPTRKKGLATSVYSLTPLLRKELNPSGQRVGSTNLFVGDPVVQLVNNSERGVHNGAVGQLVDTYNKELLVVFKDLGIGRDGRLTYSFEDANTELAPAYANTVHKAQGGEAKVVVVLVDEVGTMLDNRLLYTAMSRARQLCVVVGPTNLFLRKVRNVRKRNTGLSALLAVSVVTV